MRLTDYKFRRKFDIPKYIRTLGQKPKKIIDFSQKVCILGIILLSIFSTGMVVYGGTFIRPTAQKIGTPSGTNGQAEKNVKTGLSSTGTGIASNRVSKKAVNQDHADQRITGIKSVSAKNNQPAAQTSTYGGTVSGNGATQLHMNESLDTTNTVTNLHINNSFVTTTLSNSTVINQSVTGYTNVTGTFAITNIQATYNYTNVDNNTNIADDTTYNSNTNGLIQTSYQYAQAFTVTNAEVNMTKVRIVYTQTGSPSGDLVIYDSSGSNGSPGSEIPNSPSIALQNLPKDSNDNWTTITFASPVTLTAGKYYLVLQDTTPSLNFGSNYFTWYVQYINANTEGLYQASSGSSSWSPVNDKLLFTYESITIGSNNQPFIYTAPSAVDLTYNGNSVTSTSNNLLDLKTNTAIFTSNDSIVFDFTYQIHYSRANPIVTTITYAVANNTNPTWNVTATTDSIPSGSYSVSNRTFMLYSLPSDWNTTSVTQNDSLFTDLIYSNGSSILLLNVTSNISAYFWSMNFVSPNYMSTLTLLQNNTKTLSSPYQINTTDTLHVLATMTSKASGTNGSLLVYDPTNIINFTVANVAIISDQLNFSLWNVSQTLTSNGNPDGIYTIKAQWINTSQLELGYLTTSVQVITQTGLSASSDAGNYLTGQVIHLTGNFFSYLNNTPLNNAILAYKVGWNSTSGLLIQNGDHQDYSANITVDPSVPIGLAFITINATLSGYVNRTTQVSFNIVHNATLSYQIVENQIFYGDSVDIKIFYNDSITNTFLNQSTITVNGSIHSATLQGQGTGQYYLNSTDTANIVPYVSLIHVLVNASQQNYLPKQVLIAIFLLPSPTIITPVNGSTLNNTAVTKDYSISSADTIIQTVVFNDTRHNNATILGANPPAVNVTTTVASITANENASIGIWTLSINPNEAGTFPIMFTFTKAGYQPATYTIILSIILTPTSIIRGGNTAFVQNTTLSTYFDNGTLDEMTLLVTLHDTYYNQNLTNPAISGLTNSSTFTFNLLYLPNGTVEIIINPLINGTFVIRFTISQTGYQSQTLDINLDVLITPTQIITGGTITWKNNSNINIYYDNGDNNESFYLTYTDTNYNTTLPTPTITIYNQTAYSTIRIGHFPNGTLNMVVNFNTTGYYDIILRISQMGYMTQIIIINATVWAPGAIPPSKPDNTAVNTSTTLIYGQWSSSTTFALTYYDLQNPINITGLLLNGTISWNMSVTIGTYTVRDEGNGSYLVTVSINEMGTWIVNFTITNGKNLLPYFNSPPSFTITFVISKRTTATVLKINSSTNTTTTVYYQRSTIINITISDALLQLVANGTLQLDNNTVWIQTLNGTTTTNIFYFTINGIDISRMVILLTFTSNYYTTQTFTIYIVGIDLPTHPVTELTTNGAINATTSKLGYTYSAQFNLTLADNNSLIIDPSYAIYLNHVLITNYNLSGLELINSSSGARYSVYLLLYLLPKYGFADGIYTITILFSKYGISTTTYSFVLTVVGFGLNVVLNYPTTLVTGSDYTISVQLTYANSTSSSAATANTSLLEFTTTNVAGSMRYIILINSSTLAQNITLGGPISNIYCLFIIYIEYINGTNTTLTYSTTTNAKGQAFDTIPGAITAQISHIYSIGVATPSSTYNEPLNYMNTTAGSHILITNPNIYLTDVIIIVGLVILAVIIFLGSLFVYNKRSTTKKIRIQALKRKNAEYTQTLQFISNTYSILVSSASGLPIDNISNALYHSSQESSSLISGLSVSIDSFLHSFQADFMTQIGRPEEEIAEEDHNEEPIKTSIIQRGKFQILIVGTENFRIFVFMQEKPPKRMEEVFKHVAEELETNHDLLQGFIDERIVIPRCEQIIEKYFPLTLLTTFTIDIGRLRTYELMQKNEQVQTPMTPEAILALKRLILVRTGLIESIQGSPEKQGKDFDALVVNNQLPAVGIFHYDIAYTILEKTLKVSPEEIYIALWKGADPAVKVIIPAVDTPATP